MSAFRISTVNGLLLAAYFVPAWTKAAAAIVISPLRGIYDRANIAPAIFVSDRLELFATGTVRFAWLLALAKLLVVAFFSVFALLALTGTFRKSGDGDEALTVALIAGGVISFASMVLASRVGEAAALRLHATESLMMIGALLLVMMDTRKHMAALPAIPAPHGA
jgi:hypothetical protein